MLHNNNETIIMNTQERMTAFYEWCRKCNMDMGSNERMLDAYQRIADHTKSITVVLLLTTTTVFAVPPEHANNPEPEDMPEQSNCPWCDDDTPTGAVPYSCILWGAAIAFRRIY